MQKISFKMPLPVSVLNSNKNSNKRDIMGVVEKDVTSPITSTLQESIFSDGRQNGDLEPRDYTYSNI